MIKSWTQASAPRDGVSGGVGREGRKEEEGGGGVVTCLQWIRSLDKMRP